MHASVSGVLVSASTAPSGEILIGMSHNFLQELDKKLYEYEYSPTLRTIQIIGEVLLMTLISGPCPSLFSSQPRYAYGFEI